MLSLQSCSSILLKPQETRKANCPPISETQCDKLVDVSGDYTAEYLAGVWAGQYLLCQMKHEMLLKCTKDLRDGEVKDGN